MSQHHLLVGGAGAIGVTYADGLHKAGEKVSIHVRESHRDTFYKNDDGVQHLIFYNLKNYFYWNIILWIGAIMATSTFCYLFLSKLTFCISISTVIFFGSPLHSLLRDFIPRAAPTYIPLERVTFTPEDISEANSIQHINYIWLPVSSTQLRTVDLKAIASAAPDALIINLAPSIVDYNYLVETYPDLVDRICQGTLCAISYQNPLKGNRQPNCCQATPKTAVTTNQKGVAGFLPPGELMKIGGPKEKHETIKNLSKILTKGGLDTELYEPSPNAIEDMGTLSAIFPPFVLCLESADWKFAKLAEPDSSLLFAKTVTECIQANKAANNDKSPPKFSITITQWIVKLAAHVASIHLMQLFPMDLEVYLQYHFVKVGDQMVVHLQEYIDLAETNNTSCVSLLELKETIEKKRK